MPERRVRVTAAVCERCGPLPPWGTLRGEEIAIPFTIGAAELRERMPHATCGMCSGQVLVATEPAYD